MSFLQLALSSLQAEAYKNSSWKVGYYGSSTQNCAQPMADATGIGSQYKYKQQNQQTD